MVATYQSSISQLQADRATYYQMKTPLPTSESVLCSYCEYQSSCPLFQRNFKAKTDFSPLEQEIVALVDTYADISKQISEHKKQCEQNKKLIVDYLQAKDLREYIIDDTTLKLSYRKGIKIPDVEKVVQWLHEKGLREQGSSITRFTLASLVQKGDISVEELGESAENTPYELLLVAKKKI
ncbi:MAG: hypothetical protein LBG59_07105 [Candidatus Peribacteria bacterium]|nr:hypothetical protein [Candidatus Peribacteria bacterium]